MAHVYVRCLCGCDDVITENFLLCLRISQARILHMGISNTTVLQDGGVTQARMPRPINFLLYSCEFSCNVFVIVIPVQLQLEFIDKIW
jgi:hypothetical protein